MTTQSPRKNDISRSVHETLREWFKPRQPQINLGKLTQAYWVISSVTEGRAIKPGLSIGDAITDLSIVMEAVPENSLLRKKANTLQKFLIGE